MACEKSSRRFDLEKIDGVSMRLRSKVDAHYLFRWKKFRFVDRKKIQTIGIDRIFTLLTLCHIALWKCGLYKSSRRFDLEKIDGVFLRFPSEGGCPYLIPLEKVPVC